jgi:diguanylate cyclase (GGDEF)-like protein
LLKSSPEADVSAALLTGARLAGVAIDTRRLFSDLHHRSEYDLLTDLPNRFSMEKKLDQLMMSARRNEGVFGLIYVDLDRFKQVNDRYGHRTGDLYLQEVTRRMKLQLRTGDVLARIGGDEFIALVPILRDRADAEEIATRLERCFDEPFELDGPQLHGSASVGLAVYPEDGVSEEELQRSADAAMYANKQQKRPLDKQVTELDRVGSDVL